MDYKTFIKKSEDLETTADVRRNFYLENVLRRDRASVPYLMRAKALFTTLKSETKKPSDILKLTNLRDAFLDAAGVSRKTREHLDDSDMNSILADFVKNVVEPTGSKYVDEVTYRYLMALGEQLGGTMRNLIGKLGQSFLTRNIIAQLQMRRIDFDFHIGKGSWTSSDNLTENSPEEIKAIRWHIGNLTRTLVYNITVPDSTEASKNVDIVVFNNHLAGLNHARDIAPLFANSHNLVAMGELKSGMDRAGGDEHWKTGVHALNRIRDKYKHTYLMYIGATIERSMGKKIYTMLQDNRLDFAANLYNENQLSNLCGWLVEL